MVAPKRQRTDSGGTGDLHDSRTATASCSAAGQGEAKPAANKKPRKVSVAGTLLKAESSGPSKRAQSRHTKNEIMARIRDLIPGPGKVSENGLMLQAATRIKELEMEVESLSNDLETLQKSDSIIGSADNNSTDQGLTAATLAIEQGTNGAEAIRAVLPQPTKASGKRLLEYASEYMSDLQHEVNQLKHQKLSFKLVPKPKTPPFDSGE